MTGTLTESAIALADAIVKVPTESGNEWHNTRSGRFADPDEISAASAVRGDGMDLGDLDAFKAVFEGFTHNGLTARYGTSDTYPGGAGDHGKGRRQRWRHGGQL